MLSSLVEPFINMRAVIILLRSSLPEGKMGTDAEAFVFDHVAYQTTVVPVFSELLRGGAVVDWLEPFVKRRELKPSLWSKDDLSRYHTTLNPDLSWTRGPYDLEDLDGFDWQQRWSNSSAGDPDSPSVDTVEQLNWLFKIAVSIKCLGASQFVGRSQTPSQYLTILRELGVREDDRTVALLAALGKRGFLIGYQFGFGFEGINGWLDPSETAELAEKLDVLPLPRYEESFAAMEQFGMKGTGGGYECPGHSFEVLSLSFVRTTAALAAQQSRGLLWGNGLMPAEYYLSKRYER
jgi:hypothetical protein